MGVLLRLGHQTANNSPTHKALFSFFAAIKRFAPTTSVGACWHTTTRYCGYFTASVQRQLHNAN